MKAGFTTVMMLGHYPGGYPLEVGALFTTVLNSAIGFQSKW